MHRSNPKVLCSGRLHHKKLMEGRGMGSVLLNKGGAGNASSYGSVDQFIDDTGLSVIKGSGLGEKLHKLLVKPMKKPQNIRLEM